MYKLKNIRLLNYRYFSNNFDLNSTNKIKINGGSFDRLINFHPQEFSEVPNFLSFINYPLNHLNEFYIKIYEYTGMTNYFFIGAICLFIRLLIFPFIRLQIKHSTNFALCSPSIDFYKLVKKHDNETNFYEKYSKLNKFLRNAFKILNIKPFKIFGYYLIYLPVLITQVWVIRKFIYYDLYKNPGTFLGYIENIFQPDPYYILPLINCGLLYYNFGRFITQDNKHTRMSRIRSALQIAMIVWLPFISCWPSGIVFYITLNSAFTIFQINYTKSPIYITKLNPKLLIKLIVLSLTQNEKSNLIKYKRSLLYGESSIYGKDLITEDQLINKYNEKTDNFN